jgi:hypothetical protein
MQYNKTMLYPLGYGFTGQPTLTGGISPTVLVERDFSAEMATVTYRVLGKIPIVNPARDSVLLLAPFLVLQGNALTTDLTLTRVLFSNGLPSGGVFLKGKFIADSLCYQELRLVDIPFRNAEPELSTAPNPISAAALVHYRLPMQTRVRLSVHTILGEEVAVLDEGLRTEGTHVCSFDASQLPAGAYICRLITDAAVVTTTILHLGQGTR